MIIQDIASTIYQRVERTGRACCSMRQVWRDTQREAAAVVAHNSRSVANTEIGAAKNIYTSAQAAFRRARRDGLRQVAQRPGRYIPSGRKQTAAAYRATRKLLDRTRAELFDIASGGYEQVTAQFADTEPANEAGSHTDSARDASARTRKQATRRVASTATGPQTRRRRAAHSSDGAPAS